MSDQASPGDWIGRLIDKRFPLFEWLGAAESGQVFRTELPGPLAQKAAIRIVFADAEGAQGQFDDWVQAAGLSHPNLLHVFDTGHGAIDERELNYIVMELPEQSLSDVLPARALTASEASDLLSPVLSALAYLHSRGLVHGHVNPDHILVIGDLLKLSTDDLQQTGQMHRQPQSLRIYDAPETAYGVLSPASDVWSLGVTLVEGLTQRPPLAAGGDPDVPESMPEPFAEIARRCLRVDPLNRATLDELEAALSPPAVEAAAVTAALSEAPTQEVPAPVAAAPTPPTPTEQFAAPPQPEPPPERNLWEPASRKPAFVPIPIDEPRPARRAMPSPGDDGRRPRLGMPVILAAVAVLVIIVLAVVVRSRNAEPPSATPTQQQPAASAPESAPATQPPAQTASPAPAPATPEATPQAAPKAATPEPTPPAPAQAAPPPPQPVTGSNGKGAVAQKVMPEVLEKASRTISGKVTVKVRVQVDVSGAVSDASFDSEGPSRYFSKLALEASRKWRFEPAHVDGNAAPSEWVLHYEFRRGGTEVTPTEVKP